MVSVPATIPILYQSPKYCNWYSNGIVNWIKIMFVPMPLKVPTVLKKDPKMNVAQAKIFACVFSHKNLTVETANEKGVWMTPWTARDALVKEKQVSKKQRKGGCQNWYRSYITITIPEY